MHALRLQHPLFAFLLFAATVLAGRYNFSIEEINVNESRDAGDDDLALVIALNTGSNTLNNSWPLGSMNEDDPSSTLRRDDLVHEMEVPSASNLSVAFSIANVGDFANIADKGIFTNLVEGTVGVATNLPGPAGRIVSFFEPFVEAIVALFDCAGIVAAENIIYSAESLESLRQNEKKCETKNYTSSPPALCMGDSKYNVTFCLTRLDDPSVQASGGVKLMSGFILPLQAAFLAVAMLYGGNGFLA